MSYMNELMSLRILPTNVIDITVIVLRIIYENIVINDSITHTYCIEIRRNVIH